MDPTKRCKKLDIQDTRVQIQNKTRTSLIYWLNILDYNLSNSKNEIIKYFVVFAEIVYFSV